MESLPSYMDTLYLEHHGIKGQKWGVRRFQNEDGSLTAAGKKHQARNDYRTARNKIYDKFDKLYAEDDIKNYASARRNKIDSVEQGRRNSNARELRYREYKANQLAAKSKMSRELADNSKGIVQKFHNTRADMQSDASKRNSRMANDRKRLIKETNKMYKSMSTGEKMAAYLLTRSNDDLNQYYMDRRTRSAAQTLGARAAGSAISIAGNMLI